MTPLEAIAESKSIRKELDAVLQRVKEFNRRMKSDLYPGPWTDLGEAIAQSTLSQRDIESAIMRQGMCLKYTGAPNPYPESKNPDSPVVEPTADGLKM